MVTQDFQNFKIAFTVKRTSWKIIAFAHFLKNFQRSKKVTNIFRFTSGLLRTTDLFQIQTSTEDSKRTYLEGRLFQCHAMCVALYMYTWQYTVGWSEIPTLTLKKNVHHSLKCFVSRWGSPTTQYILFNGWFKSTFQGRPFTSKFKKF
jgi:hypothetical protein